MEVPTIQKPMHWSGLPSIWRDFRHERVKLLMVQTSVVSNDQITWNNWSSKITIKNYFLSATKIDESIVNILNYYFSKWIYILVIKLNICIYEELSLLLQSGTYLIFSSLKITAWKVSKYGVISGPHFPVFGRYSWIWTRKC